MASSTIGTVDHHNHLHIYHSQIANAPKPAGVADADVGPAGNLPPSSGSHGIEHLATPLHSPGGGPFLGGDSPSNSGNNTQRVIKRRAPVACRRCRRMRSKCVHFGAKPPCEGCRIANVSLDECVFPVRGAPDLDRDYRHPRMKGDKARKEGVPTHRPQLSGSSGGGSRPQNGASSASPGAGPSYQLQHSALTFVGGAATSDPWELLPSLDQIIDAVDMFTCQYFQLGFIPRHTFIQQLREHPRSVSAFLLLGILSVSARMTPSLVESYGGAVATAEVFMDRASSVAQAELYEEPTLARCQAFYLLSLAQQGSGYRNRSFVNMAIALRMAILMCLHHEETYALVDPTPAMVQEAESARRTLWMLYSQDNLHAGRSAPVSLAASDITTLLPSDEDDFNDGILPKMRAALEDTPPARKNPALVSSPTRSLFATLMQSHQLWGIVLRRAVRNDRSARPWDSKSEYATISTKLNDWESRLPREHLWSLALLRHNKAKGLDLAYVAVTMVTRLCNIVIRRAYLSHMLAKTGTPQQKEFWKTMSGELFTNVRELFIQIDCWIQEREPGDGTGAQLAIFCVYSCCLMAAHLCKNPTLCPDANISREGQHMLDRTMGILAQSTNVWPLARRWIESVEKVLDADQSNTNIAHGSHEAGMAEGKDPIPSALHPAPTYSAPSGPSNTPFDDHRLARHLGPGSPHARSVSPSLNGGHGNGAIGNSFTSNSSSVSHNAPRHPPQIRTNDSLLNTSMLLPLPHPSPSHVTTMAAAHYATTSAAPLPQAQPTSGGGTLTPTSLSQQAQQQQMQPHRTHQYHRLPSPHHAIGTALSPGMTNSLASVGGSSNVSPTGSMQQRPLLPSTTGHDVSMMVPSVFNTEVTSTAEEAGAAAVLVGGMLSHNVLGFGGAHSQSHHSPQQQHQQDVGAFTAHDHLATVDHLGGSGMSLVSQMQTPQFEPLDDGYRSELQLLMQGPMQGNVWGSNMFGY